MGHSRTASASLAFDFNNGLLPLSLSEAVGDGEPQVEKTVGLLNGIALVVGLQIGSGIFSSPGAIVAETGSVGSSLMVWLVGGILAWTGASSYAELGSAIPISGGAQAYLAYAYNPLISFLFTWTCITTTRTGSNAIIATIFAEYVNRVFWHVTRADSSPDAIPTWAIKTTACLAVIFITVLCASSPNAGTRTAVVFTVVKLGSLLAIAVLGMIQLVRGKESTSLTDPLFSGTTINLSSYAIALYSGLWAFDGWDQVNYVAGEMKNPTKTLPRVIHSSMIIVMILFLSTNLAYFAILDKDTVGRSNTVALDFGRTLFGSVGAIVFSCVVAFSCFGALVGSFFTSGSLIFSASREHYLPAVFGRLNARTKTPVNALILQCTITLGFIIFGGGFRSLINFYSVAGWSFYFLTVLGLVVLRIKEPSLERPYKTFIITPLIFCAVALFLLCMPITAAPLEALSAFGFILSGIPVYIFTRKRDSSRIYDDDDTAMSQILRPIKDCIAHLPLPGNRAGWSRVRTEVDGEERMEMLERS
jgi:amino acid transporter